jgi:hypothetical protein
MNSTTGADSTALSMAALVSEDSRRRNLSAAGLEAIDHGLGIFAVAICVGTNRVMLRAGCGLPKSQS